MPAAPIELRRDERGVLADERGVLPIGVLRPGVLPAAGCGGGGGGGETRSAGEVRVGGVSEAQSSISLSLSSSAASRFLSTSSSQKGFDLEASLRPLVGVGGALASPTVRGEPPPPVPDLGDALAAAAASGHRAAAH